MKNLQQENKLYKLAGNIITTAIIDPDDVSIVLRKFFDDEKIDILEEHILVDSCVIKINNCVCIKASVSVNSIFFSLPILNLITNDINHYVDFKEEEVQEFIKKIDTVIGYILKP